jgi:hypothetical protein
MEFRVSFESHRTRMRSAIGPGEFIGRETEIAAAGRAAPPARAVGGSVAVADVRTPPVTAVMAPHPLRRARPYRVGMADARPRARPALPRHVRQTRH